MLLGALLEAGAKAAGKTVQEVGEGFGEVVFSTNVTYTDGHFKGGMSLFLLSSETSCISCDGAGVAVQRYTSKMCLAWSE